MKKEKYLMVRQNTTVSLIAEINDLHLEGYAIQGNIFTYCDEMENNKFCQLMALKDEPK